MANVKCPKCQNLISGVQAGQTVKCSKCGYSMKLSGSASTQPKTPNKQQGETKLCKYCQTEIPKKAKICPNCRKKQKGKIGGIVAVVVIILLLAAATGSGDNKPKRASGTSTDSKASSNSSKNEMLFRKGEVAELNGVQVTLTDYKESTGSEYNEPTDGNVFLMVEFEIENNTDKEISVSSMLSFEAYADSYALNYSISALMEKEGNQLDGSIAAGKKMRGWIGWEVPTNYQNVEIHFTDNVWSSNIFVFLIEK